MNNITNLKTIGQNSVNHLLEMGKQQPAELQTWGVTAAGAVAGSLILNAGAQGLLSVLSALASLPVSLTVGAIGGGTLGWMYVQQRKAMSHPDVQSALVPGMQPSEDLQEIVVESSSPDIVIPDRVADAIVENEGATNNQTSEPLMLAETAEIDGGRVEEPSALEIAVATESAELPPSSIETATAESLNQPEDRLEAISGIGQAFARHLRSAGIYTFAQLAELSPEQLQTLMSSARGGKLIDAARWIDQAKQFAATK